ncbi:aldo/keto reductase [Gracilinema caldarium]|uniref:Aldehyde reductase n=1 Tax=Gracilinema caldarium (strain ATCC 51460 / DSM 7334 / H1) TaxID=744872 RepID=F8F3U0_GRAC1|nr:aldo/keto reductase [Gracilinema caldarium]AEJ20459.1 Aldehyde reductase [Gracilinema caldarium DSM 7334]
MEYETNPIGLEQPIDPCQVPYHSLPGGGKIPGIGLGTFGSDSVDAKTVAAAVRYALGIGYRHIDCAAVYLNEKEIGEVLRDAMDGRAGYPAIKREDLWITSKLWNDKHAPHDVSEAFKQSLYDLGLEYLDVYLVHWPFPNYHPPKCDVNSRSPNARPYIHDEFMATWMELEKLVDQGLVRYIGTSNMTIPKLQLVLRDARIRPVVNEMELHPHFQQPELFTYVVSQGMVPIAYAPLGSPGRPERDRTVDDTVDMEDPVILEIARRRSIHPAQVCLKWAIKRGQIPIPFSVNPKNIRSNLESVIQDPLTDQEMRAISSIDKNCRLIKGQVFLWKGARGWEDLWDLDGKIAGWNSEEVNV